MLKCKAERLSNERIKRGQKRQNEKKKERNDGERKKKIDKEGK